MSKIEEVAKAMAANDSGPEGSELFDIHWREFGDGYLANARAAIEAMRELTDDMHKAAHQAMFCRLVNTEGECRQTFTAGFNAAIDAALNEVKG